MLKRVRQTDYENLWNRLARNLIYADYNGFRGARFYPTQYVEDGPIEIATY
jgi:hypothetical protein